METTTTTCKVCGNPVHVTGLVEQQRERLLNVGICYNCDFWVEKFQMRYDPNVLRIDGQHYIITDSSFGSFNTHGRKVRMLKTGEVRTVHHLSHQGRIPTLWQETWLYDNAEWVEG